MFAGYSSRGGARGSSYAQGHHAQVEDVIKSVIGRDMLQKLQRSVPAVVTTIQKRMQAHAEQAGLSPRAMMDDLGIRVAKAKNATRYKDFSMIHANVFIDKVYPRAGAADPKQIARQRFRRR
jgi:hypothetical protein